jgi:hypothetical protein
LSESNETQAPSLEETLKRESVRARWTTILLAIAVALDAIAVLSSLAQLVVLQRIAEKVPGFEALASENDSRQQLIAALQIGAFIVTGIAFLVWVHGAYRTLTLVGTRTAKFTPGWAVGYWFIPFINLVRPYQILKELWQRSESRNSEANLAGNPSPGLVGCWWAA